MCIKFVAVVDAQNAPVYFRSRASTPDDVAVNHQFISEMSLDFVEQQSTRIQADLGTPVLALVHDGVAVYVTLSNTRTKYLIGIDALQEPGNIESVMSSLQDAYVAYLCNPFRGDTKRLIQSPHFDRKIDRILSGASVSGTTSGERSSPHAAFESALAGKA